MSSLPQPTTQAECDDIDRKAGVFAEAVRLAFPEHAAGQLVEATSAGSYPVFYVGGEYVAKLYSPLDVDFFSTEHAALDLLSEAPDIPAPGLIATAEIDGWHALLMQRLPGESLRIPWPTLEDERKERLCRALGKIVGALHALDPGPVRPSSPDWESFVAEQIRGCAERQRKRGLREELADQIPGFLDSVDFGPPAPHVLLHTEVMLDHLLADRANGDLRITGLIDFEPAMVGPSEYELAAIGLFVTQGHSELLRAFIAGYGRQPDRDLHRRIMGYALLHRYSRMSWYLEFMPAGDSLEELAEKWFGRG